MSRAASEPLRGLTEEERQELQRVSRTLPSASQLFPGIGMFPDDVDVSLSYHRLFFCHPICAHRPGKAFPDTFSLLAGE
jgi:hypothetical protein